ncbi:MAG: hypothetical protein M1835_001350 [Candelina submexicana]|nr:MAG: hypothetical protein M1835_001350 [Candelina submexicana]
MELVRAALAESHFPEPVEEEEEEFNDGDRTSKGNEEGSRSHEGHAMTEAGPTAVSTIARSYTFRASVSGPG